MPNKRYLLLDHQRGIFLGTDGLYAFFSEVNPRGSTHAVTFSSEKEALDFGYENLNMAYPYSYTALPIELPKKDRFASVIQLIHAGYGEYTADMFTHLPNFHRTPQ